MAQKITLVDDIDGTPIDAEGGTVRFSVDGSHYEIDLSSDNTKKLHTALEDFIANARRSRPGTSTDRGAGIVAAAARKSDPKQLKAIREWARENGHEVSDRGRIPQPVIDAYDAAN